MSTHILLALFILGLLQTGDCHRRPAHRRKDTTEGLYIPQPTAESLERFAQATGAAGFEDYTEGKALVKRLIPDQPNVDVVEHQGVIGKAGIDFPALPSIPPTGFNCKDVPTGYYADLETACQVFHICDTSRKISFLCPNGTIFSQSHLICDWWFKVDCAAAPALYESSVEYYSNEQRKSQKVSHSLTRNPDLQQIGDPDERAESRRATVNVPSTTERLLRHKQKLQADGPQPARATARSYQALFDVNPTQRAQATTAFEKRRRNLVQLISTNFGNTPSRTTLPTYDFTTPKAVSQNIDYNGPKEMQVVAESASFVNNQNRQFLQQYSTKNLRPYAVYTPNSKVPKPKSTLIPLYDITAQPINQYVEEASTKRQTLVPYTKSYASEKREPYTRPGVSLLRDFLEREKNKTTFATTEKTPEVTARSDKFNREGRVLIETKNSFESVTKIPQTTRNFDITDVSATNTINTYATTTPTEQTTATPSYQERRERLIQKMDFEIFGSTEPTPQKAYTEKFYGNQPNRPGLIVPPALTPKTLHSFAIYYATALDNLSTSSPADDNAATTQAIDEYEPLDDKLPGLFSRKTINKYSNLFGQGISGQLQEEMKMDPNETYNEILEDLSLQMSQTPLASSPQIRELAQVFTHALSAYLQDPVKFRKVLSDIRPTHPSFPDMPLTTEEINTEPTTTVNEDDHEILGFSDDNKERYPETFRGGKALNFASSDYTIKEETVTTAKPTTTDSSALSTTTSPKNPFRCCGRISASYTTAQPTTNLFANLPSNKFDGIKSENLNVETTTKPVDDYSEVTNSPSSWDGDKLDSTFSPITNSHQMFESKKIKLLPDTTPIPFPENDSIELENEEELQRAHSQSFVLPQSNNLRQGKQLKIEDKTLRKPSGDLEAPKPPSVEITTTQASPVTSTTIRENIEASTTVAPIVSSIFTSPDSDKPFNEFQWSTPLENWQSTGLDPITLNDGLSPTGPEITLPDITQMSGWASTGSPADFVVTSDPIVSSTVSVEATTSGGNYETRFGKFLREQTSTEPGQDLTTITDTVVEKAKEIMEGMNATTTQKLMNVMKKTKSKTVKRLILLLVQTCDDDHNKTAEASKKALLDALMAVSQKDMEEITENAKEDITESPTTVDLKTTEYYRRSDRFEGRRGKSLNVEADAVNSLSFTTTTEKTEEPETTTSYRTTTPSRRGNKRFQTKTEPTTTERIPTTNFPVAAARVAAVQGEIRNQSDARALELLRSLYTIAARWG
ncbi:mucin-5AC [Aricia agestis]|uniref:mucin-5AC n=1 Tax=Aricia agestis TaxID=91739 RepID=UPI001C206A42|nr:mucin-5AC [Aricia agestis]